VDLCDGDGLGSDGFGGRALRLSVREYVATNYHPDREYLDGTLVERNVGERDHSRIQTDLSTCLNVRADSWASECSWSSGSK